LAGSTKPKGSKKYRPPGVRSELLVAGDATKRALICSH